MKYQRICKNADCGKVFLGTRTQQYCCLACRPPRYIPKKTPKQIKNSTINEVAKIAKDNGMSYGQYVAMQYKAERMKK